MQYENGIYKWLAIGWVYGLFHCLIGGKKERKWLARNFWRCSGGEKVIDMGCGTGWALDYLPDSVNYIGFDISEEYIHKAREKVNKKARFLVGTAHEFIDNIESPLNMADLILCNGLLHHLDDEEALKVLMIAKNIMSPTGRLVCLEPTFLAYQTWLSRWIISKDRGGNVRSEREWKELISQVFDSSSTSILTGFTRLPYVHIVIECNVSGK